MPGEVRGILVLRLGASVSETIRNEFYTAVEETCQGLGIRHTTEDRRESEGWIRSFCMVSPAAFSRSPDAVQWAREMACHMAERIQCREALSSTKYCGVWIHLEEVSEQSGEQLRPEKSGEPGEDSGDGKQEGEELF
jgi:hypothetical protein